MRGKYRSRARTGAGERIVAGSVGAPKARPVIGGWYYCSNCMVNRFIVLAHSNLLLCIIAIFFFLVFSVSGYISKCITKEKKPLQIFKTKRIQCIE